jgi:hypothetical protein
MVFIPAGKALEADLRQAGGLTCRFPFGPPFRGTESEQLGIDSVRGDRQAQGSRGRYGGGAGDKRASGQATTSVMQRFSKITLGAGYSEADSSGQRIIE